MHWGKIALFLASISISTAAGLGWYKYALGKPSVLGASTHIVTLSKDLLIPIAEASLKRYYELIPSQIYVETPDWQNEPVHYNINSDGINDASEYSHQKMDGVFRIMTIGDSFTFGQYVDTKDNYPKQLNTILQNSSCSFGTNVEVLNLGVPGYDIQHIVAHYDRKGKQYNPDLIVWLINQHNLYQIHEKIGEIEDALFANTSKEKQEEYKRKGEYYWYMIQATDTFIKKVGVDAIFSEQLTYLQKFSEIYKGPLLIVMFSGTDQASKDVITKFANSRPLTYVSSDLPDLSSDKRLPDTHPNAQGYSAISSYIYNQMNVYKLISCNF